MSIENEAPAETIDPTSDAFGADELATGANHQEGGDTTDPEEWGEEKPDGDDDPDDAAEEEGEGDEGEGAKPERHMVPISRLKKEAEKRRAIERDVAELRAQVETLKGGGQSPAPAVRHDPNDALAEIRTTDPEVAQIEAWITKHDPKKLNPDDYATQGEYQRAVTDALVNQTQGINALNAKKSAHEIAKANKSAQAQAAEVAYYEKLGTRYEATLAASKIPNVTTYAKNVAVRATQLAPEIQKAILEHPEPDVIAAALGSNRKVFDEFAQATKKGVTHATMMRLGEVVASYKAGLARSAEDPAPAPRKPLDPPRRRPAGGDPMRSDDRSGTLSVGNRSLAEIRKDLGLY